MKICYRFDYIDPNDQDNIIVSRYYDDRRVACNAARQRSVRKNIDIVYCIKSVDGLDVGASVYVNGFFSHHDGDF